MKRVDWSPALTLPDRPRVTALGAFDGVHLGHAKTIQAMRRIARTHDAEATILTFDPGPREFNGGDRLPGRRLTPLDEQLFYLRRLGVDLVVVFEFPGEIHAVEPEEFVRDVLVAQFSTVHVVASLTHRFGYRGSGDIHLLQKLGDELGFGVDILEPVLIGAERVSSTRIRDLLEEGEVHEAGGLLGRPYAIHAPVMTGRGMGRQIGYPTANLQIPPEKILPRDGVYSGLAGVVDSDDYETMEQTRGAAINVGLAPTVRDEERVVEVHVIGEHCDFRGKSLKVEFLRWLRAEEEFEDLKSLSKQIGIDTERAAAIAQAPLTAEMRQFQRMCTTDHVIRRSDRDIL